MYWVFVVSLAVAGVVAGRAGRALLARSRRPVAVRAWCCEIGTGVLCGLAGTGWALGAVPVWWLPVPVLLGALAVPLVAADIVDRRLPDVLTVPAYPLLAGAVGLAAALSSGWELVAHAGLGALAFGVAHGLAHLVAPSSLGAGDVKLSGSLGCVLGAVGAASMVLAACLAAAVTALVAAVSAMRCAAARGRGPPGVPHGPGLLGATWLVAVLGAPWPGVGS